MTVAWHCRSESLTEKNKQTKQTNKQQQQQQQQGHVKTAKLRKQNPYPYNLNDQLYLKLG